MREGTPHSLPPQFLKFIYKMEAVVIYLKLTNLLLRYQPRPCLPRWQLDKNFLSPSPWPPAPVPLAFRHPAPSPSAPSPCAPAPPASWPSYSALPAPGPSAPGSQGPWLDPFTIITGRRSWHQDNVFAFLLSEMAYANIITNVLKWEEEEYEGDDLV